MDYMSQLPIDIFVPIVFLSFDTSTPIIKLIRTEKIRLVSKAWQAAIDSTPLFWTCISNLPRFSQTIQGWIRKSKEAPLHILYNSQNRSFDEFMQLLIPHRRRWRRLEATVNPDRCISQYLKEPAPRLEELVMFFASLVIDYTAFGDVTPSLSSVVLSSVGIPETTRFLKNLKHLRLEWIQCSWGDVSVGRLYDILEACPGLETLELDAKYIDHPPDQQPVLLAKLSKFRCLGYYGPQECIETVLGMVIAPRLRHFCLRLSGGPVPRNLNVLSPLSTGLLGTHEKIKYRVFISNGRFVLSSIDAQPQLQWYPDVCVHTQSDRGMAEVAPELLHSFEKGAPPSATLDLVLDQSLSTRAILNYLKSTTEDINGKLEHPVPQIRSIRLNVVVQP
ncbi:hypothetical protein FS837_007938, partial [Tulasnella sp. UAMH 9824]